MVNEREQRGLALAALYRIDKADGKYLVPSQTGNGTRYEVVLDATAPTCNCPDFRDRGIKCKHLFAVEFVLRREQNPDGTVTVERAITIRERVTFRQNWPAYNAAQTNEKRRFQILLAELCRGLAEPPRPPGCPPLPIADAMFSAIFKVYCGYSTRRFNGDLEDARDKGHIAHVPHFNSVLNYLDKPFTATILHALIAETSRPLKAIETDFAVDSSGFATSRFVRWFDVKYGRTVAEQEWVKVHLMCGVKTNVVTAVEIHDKHAGDCPQLPPLLDATARTFDVREVSADAAYLRAISL